jgi:hypothetical protein
MIDAPVVVWPPGTFYGDCTHFGGNFYDCSYDYPGYESMGVMVCCPGW